MTLEKVRQRAESDAQTHGYYLNPDPSFLKDLLEGLKRNEERYGYHACPCRLASGNFALDRDIICPCDYRDPDVEEFGSCYCALYVRKNLFDGHTPVQPIPERRPKEKQDRAQRAAETLAEKPSEAKVFDVKKISQTKMRIWFCKVCGYVCFREDPPYICPICKAKRQMFAEMAMGGYIQA